MSAAVSTPEVTEAPVADAREQAIALVNEAAKETEAESPKEEAAAPTEPVVDPKAERVASRIAVAKRAEIRAAKERQDLKAKEESLAAREADVDAKLARYKLLEENPEAAFEELKIDPKDFLNKLARLNDPNAIVTKKVTALEEALKKEREERERLQHESTRQQRAMQVELATRHASAQFIEHVSKTADKYPHLVDEFTPDEIVSRALAVATQHGQAYKERFGEYPTDEVIAEHLETEAAKRAKAKSAWRERIGKSAKQPGQGTTGDSENGQPVTAASPRTLTSRSAAQKASAPKSWSQKDADDEARAIIRKMHEADSG